MPTDTPNPHDDLLARAHLYCEHEVLDEDDDPTALVADLAAALRAQITDSGCEWREEGADGPWCQLSGSPSQIEVGRLQDQLARIRADIESASDDHAYWYDRYEQMVREATDWKRWCEEREADLAEARAAAPDHKPEPGSWDDRIEAVLLELEDDGDEPIDPHATTFERLEIWQNRARLAAAYILRHLEARAPHDRDRLRDAIETALTVTTGGKKLDVADSVRLVVEEEGADALIDTVIDTVIEACPAAPQPDFSGWDIAEAIYKTKTARNFKLSVAACRFLADAVVDHLRGEGSADG